MTMTVGLVAPPCLDASHDDVMEEDVSEGLMPEMFDMDHGEAARIDGAGKPKLLVGRFGCLAGDTQSHLRNTSLSFGWRSMLCVSGKATALIFVSCRIVNWWSTAGDKFLTY